MVEPRKTIDIRKRFTQEQEDFDRKFEQLAQEYFDSQAEKAKKAESDAR